MNQAADTTTLQTSAAKVVHEAIDERQHVRTKFPAKVILRAGEETIQCDVADISLGGIGLNCDRPLPLDRIYEASVQLRLNKVELTLEVKVKTVSQNGNQFGTQFIDLGAQKADILRYLISAYMSGEIADIDGLFNVMQRENYIKERKQKYDTTRTLAQRLRAVAGSALFVLVGVLAAGYVVSKAYLLFFRVPAAYAVVGADAYVVAMPENGNVRILVPEGQQRVSPGQPVASISTQLATSLTTPADLAALAELAPGKAETLLGRATVETVIVSPCDCEVVYPRGRLEGFGYKSDTLMHLVPADMGLYVQASVPFDKLEKIRRTRRVDMNVYGSEETVSGQIVRASVNEEEQMVVLDIRPDQPLARAAYRQPVWVEFYLGMPGFNGLSTVADSL